MYHDYIALRYNTGINSKIQLPYVNKLYNNSHIDDQIYGKIELKPLQNIILMEND